MRPTFIPGTNECPGLIGIWKACPLPGQAADIHATETLLIFVALVLLIAAFAAMSLLVLWWSMRDG